MKIKLQLALLFLTLSFIIASCSTQMADEDEPTVLPSETADGFKDMNVHSASADTTAEDNIESEIRDQDQVVAQKSESQDVAQNPQPNLEENPPPPQIMDAEAQAAAEASIPQEPVVDSSAQSAVTAVEPPAPSISGSMVKISSLKYQSFDGGGTLVISGDGPMQYQTRTNPTTQQMVIEIPNSKLSKKALRPLNTKDFTGNIGSVDAYQDQGSTTSRIVVQLRDVAQVPSVQTDGNSILVLASQSSVGMNQVVASQQAAPVTSENDQETEDHSTQILSSQNFEDFLSGNMKFYGKKISIETEEIEIREALQLIAEESGVNLLVSDDVKGKIRIRLRDVPWDQALVMIMKTKKLGYTRMGSILRIASIDEIKSEEALSLKLALDRKSTQPQKVTLIPVNYAKIEDLVSQVKPFLNKDGQVVGDTRTSSLVISDDDTTVKKIITLVKSIDVPPQQVMIEGKVVEASEAFARSIGINWMMSGKPNALFDEGNKWTSQGGSRIRMNQNIAVSPGIGNTIGTLGFSLGTMDTLGDLTATLGLYEREGSVKVISSPRVMAIHNEPAEINQSTEIPLLNTVTNTGGQNQTNVTFKAVKLRLGVTPLITNEGSVVMKIDVSREFPGTIVDEKSQARPVSTRSAATKVLVQNGQTAVIGGIYQSDANESENRVPFLGKIPIIGWLFKSSTVQTDKNELLIFLTPRIMNQRGVFSGNGGANGSTESIDSGGGAEETSGSESL